MKACYIHTNVNIGKDQNNRIHFKNLNNHFQFILSIGKLSPTLQVALYRHLKCAGKPTSFNQTIFIKEKI